MFMLVGEEGSGVALQFLILLNFINIAERRSFSAIRRRRVMYRHHVMVMGRNKRPVERSVVILRRTAAHCCENIVSLITKFNLPTAVLSLKFLNSAMRHN